MPDPTSFKHPVAISYLSPVQWLSDQLGVAAGRLDICASSTLLPPWKLNPSVLGQLSTPAPLKLAQILSRANANATQETVTAIEVGHALIEQLEQMSCSIWMAPSYWMHPNGWLYAQFDANALAHWLQQLLDIQPQLISASALGQNPLTNGISPYPIHFALQLAHARCCSLLRLGQQAQLIPFTDSLNWSLPNPVPWQTSQGQLRLQTTAEQQGLQALMQFPALPVTPSRWHLDSNNLETQSPISWPLNERILQIQIQQWTQVFFDFYQQCRIIGLPAKDLALVQTRLAFTMLLKNILKFWLQEILRIEAPTVL